MNPPPTPAGWYPDGTVLRYWDGRMWTAQTAPLVPPQVSPPMPRAQQDGSVTEQPRRNPWLRKRVLIPTGALALLFLLALIAPSSGGSSPVPAADPVPLAGGLASASPTTDAAAQKAAADKAAAEKAASEKAAAEKAAAEKAAAEKAAVVKAAADKAAAEKAAAQKAAADKAAAQARAAQQAAAKVAAEKAAAEKAAQQAAAAQAAAQQAAAQQAAQAAAAAASSLDPRFGTCKAANAAGYGPYYRGVDPEYDWYQDRDHDGIDCER